MKPKTVKDLKRDCGHIDTCAIEESTLRQELTKWFISKEILNMTAQEFIFVFNNLTHEEIKEFALQDNGEKDGN